VNLCGAVKIWGRAGTGTGEHRSVDYKLYRYVKKQRWLGCHISSLLRRRGFRALLWLNDYSSEGLSSIREGEEIGMDDGSKDGRGMGGVRGEIATPAG
jgi:hypothetical protein